MKLPIADLHCDLLCYLAGGMDRTPYDSRVRCSITQMMEGNVKLQVLPIYTPTDSNSLSSGKAQLESYRSLVQNYSHIFDPYQGGKVDTSREKIAIALSVENASSFFPEGESLTEGFARLSQAESEYGKVTTAQDLRQSFLPKPLPKYRVD